MTHLCLYWFCWTNLFLVHVILKSCDSLVMPLNSPRVCIIGAGYSGLAAARYMRQYGLNFTVFEATRHIGGTWRFDPHVGHDEDGLPLFTSMYKGLRMNTARQIIEYANFPFPENTPSYPFGTCFYKYLQSFVKYFDLAKYIQFRSYITSVKWKGNYWSLTYLRKGTRKNHTETCDFVVVANGYFTKPHIPTFEGQDIFKGKIVHSHDYKDTIPYFNRKVLLVGGNDSGLDLATTLANVTLKLVLSHHRSFNDSMFASKIISKPDIDMFRPKGILFQDGTFEEIDDVILCTGYVYDHQFLDESTEVTMSPKFLMPLYQNIVNIKHPSMVFIGKVKTSSTRVFDTQAEYAAALVAKKFQLPSEEKMLDSWLTHLHSLLANGFNILNVNTIHNDDMDQYFRSLIQEAGLSPIPKVISKIRNKSLYSSLEDFLHYRDYDFKILDGENFVRNYNPRGDVCPITL